MLVFYSVSIIGRCVQLIVVRAVLACRHNLMQRNARTVVADNHDAKGVGRHAVGVRVAVAHVAARANHFRLVARFSVAW